MSFWKRLVVSSFAFCKLVASAAGGGINGCILFVSRQLVSNMKSVFGEERVHLGGNITSDSYFSTQGL